MQKPLHIVFDSYPVTVIAKRYREQDAAVYELTETTRWFSPKSRSVETKSLYLCGIGER